MNCKKCIASCCSVFVVVLFALYFALFYHGSAEDILAANVRSKVNVQRQIRKKLNPESPDYDPFEAAHEAWDAWISDGNYVSIGETYDNCDENDRIMVGRTIMLPDKRFGGVKARSLLNISWDREISEGKIDINVQYNGKDLYENTLDLCTVDKKETDRLIFCPIQPSFYYYKKDFKIPLYLPKGRYSAQIRIHDQTKETILCALADFVL